jgi:uncharacterized protein (TIGR02598 family)
MSRHNKGGHQGFSLVEVVLSLGVTAFAMVALMGLLTVGLKASKTTSEQTLGSLIAQDASSRSKSLITASQSQFDQALNGAVNMIFYYDSSGLYLAAGNSSTDKFFRATVTSGKIQNGLPNVKTDNICSLSIIIESPDPVYVVKEDYSILLARP